MAEAQRSELKSRRRPLGLVALTSIISAGLTLSGAVVAGVSTSAASMPSVSFVSPKPEQTVTSTTIHLQLSVANFHLECEHAGQADVPGQGHIHIMVDGADMAHLINMYCSTTIRIAGQGLAPGKHTIMAVLAGNMHDMASHPASVVINYRPRVAPPSVPKPQATGTPAIRIVYPANGAAVSPKFDLKVAWSHFHPSCALEGKTDVVGYGHIHVFVDPNVKAMKSGNMALAMTGLIGMPCQHSIPLNLSGWKAGVHTLMVVLVNNDHSPVMPMTAAMVKFDLK